MTEFNRESYLSAGPVEAAELVRSTPDSQLTEVMRSPDAPVILDDAFDRLPKMFSPEAAGGTQAVVHWAISDAKAGIDQTYEMVIDSGVCAVSKTPAQEPKVTMSMNPVTFLKIISGAGDPLKLFMMGKVKAKGDLGLAANAPKFFEIPRG